MNIFVTPIILESVLLSSVPVLIALNSKISYDLLACVMLFAMGLQNSLVTKVSNATVRTTHLTGLFTDLGIEFSQLIFPKSRNEDKLIRAYIQLHLSIILFFFLGGLFAGYLFVEAKLVMNTLYVSSAILIVSLFYDNFRYEFL